MKICTAVSKAENIHTPGKGKTFPLPTPSPDSVTVNQQKPFASYSDNLPYDEATKQTLPFIIKLEITRCLELSGANLRAHNWIHLQKVVQRPLWLMAAFTHVRHSIILVSWCGIENASEIISPTGPQKPVPSTVIMKDVTPTLLLQTDKPDRVEFRAG